MGDAGSLYEYDGAPAGATAVRDRAHGSGGGGSGGSDGGGDGDAPARQPRGTGGSPGRDSGSLLLARAKAAGSVSGVHLMSVDDLFSDDDDDGGAAHAPPRRDGGGATVDVSDGGGGAGDDAAAGALHRSEYANVREGDARLHWPPTGLDYTLDEEEESAGTLAARRVRLSRRGKAHDARRLYEEALEEQLTNLVMMMALEEAATAVTPPTGAY